jgi:diguanylate cyclase (GGDEF)-like protein
MDENGRNLCQNGCPLQMTLQDGLGRDAYAYLHHAEGHRLPVSLRVSAIRDADGRITGAVQVFQDASERMAFIQRIKELEALAMLDPLTALANRRLAEQHLEIGLDSLRRYEWGFGVLMVDVDHFKIVNDTYGHSVGDDVLRMLGRVLAKNVRSVDVVGRWGGDEFLVMQPNTTLESLRGASERLRLLVRGSSLDEFEEPLGVTVSIGATLARSTDDIKRLVGRADVLLYRAKSDGRDRVVADA